MMFYSFKQHDILLRHLWIIFFLIGYSVFGQNSHEISDSTFRVGQQIWMSKNLSVDHFRNGDSIPEAVTKRQWRRAARNQEPAWCYYKNDSELGALYGKLYNFYAIQDQRGLAPRGWRVANEQDWLQLIESLGGDAEAGSKLKSTLYWKENQTGTDAFGFGGLPAGYRYHRGRFFSLGYYTAWWTSDAYGKYGAWVRPLFYNHAMTYRTTHFRGFGLSVRCVLENLGE